MSSPPLSIESLAQVVQQLQTQILNQQTMLSEANESYKRLESRSTPSDKPKKHKPEKYDGKSSVTSWTIHMDNYLEDARDDESLPLAVSYLTGAAHEWWIVFRESDDGEHVQSWGELKKALVSRFDTLNKEKIARDKLARWRQVKDVPTFNNDFQKILLDIPNISKEEQVDRYTRGLKGYIWKELCTKDYDELSEAMRDAERVEAAHRRVGMRTAPVMDGPRNRMHNNQKPVPMELGNTQLRKLSPQEREDCMKKGLCLRCREKGHLAKNCPKGKRD